MDNGSSYTDSYTSLWTPDEEYAALDMSLSADRMVAMLTDELELDKQYWDKPPYKLAQTDKDNTRLFLEGKLTENSPAIVKSDDEHIDNRLFPAMRAILSYATGRLAVPELTPSKNDDQFVKMARQLQKALYQHSLDEDADDLFRVAAANLVMRKRAFIKQRFDPDAGLYGDIVSEVIDPSDMVIDRFAKYKLEPDRMNQRIRISVEELCARFPKQRDLIWKQYKIETGAYAEVSGQTNYWESWFSYRGTDQKKHQAVSWWLPQGRQLLDKQPNPNWVYEGSDKKQKYTNVMFQPPKPYVWFNYLGLGRSFIDETSLFDQAKPLQLGLNHRIHQFNRNVDLANGRWLYDKGMIEQKEAENFVNKGGKTLLGVTPEPGSPVANAMSVMTPNNVAPQIYESIQDYRSEIDGNMGTPSIFQGKDPASQNTLGRDMAVKQQAGMLQDDLVRTISKAAKRYYQLKLQMFRVYYTDDYWFNIKGGDGKFDFIMINGDTLDSNVRIGVETDSTLPLDKEAIRNTALELAKMGKIDQLTLLEDLGVPDPEIRTERFLRSQIDFYTYMQSVETSMDNSDAEVDIQLLVAGKDPQERDSYDESYLNYFNHFITMGRFAKLPQQVKQRLIQFLQQVSAQAQQTASLQETLTNDAGIINRPPIFPLPKRTENIRLNADVSPQMADQLAQNEGQMFTPVSQAQQAQDPNAQGQQPQDFAGPGQ